MLYWLLLLGCAFANTAFGNADFTVGQKWQIILESPPIVTNSTKVIPTDAAVWDIDLFDSAAGIIEALKLEGKIVICYFSAGTYESWRPDANKFTAADRGASLAPQWPDEYWLNTKSANVRSIMTSRIEMAVSKGCDAVDPDNVDGYDNPNGLGLTTADAVDYVKFLAQTASSHNMSMGLKNAQTIIPDVVSAVQFAVNEQCVQFGQCDGYTAFIGAGKPVFHIEYPNSAPISVSETERNLDCNPLGVTGLSTVMKNMTLGGWVAYCDGTYVTTPTINGDGNGGNRPPPPSRPSTRPRPTSIIRPSTIRTTTSSSTAQEPTIRTSSSETLRTSSSSTTEIPTTRTTEIPTTRTTEEPTRTTTSSRTTLETTTSRPIIVPPPPSRTQEPPTTRTTTSIIRPTTTSRTTTSIRTTSTSRTSSRTTSNPAPTNGGGGNGCVSKHWDQCGGQNWNGCTRCDTGLQCKPVSPPYYYQCL